MVVGAGPAGLSAAVYMGRFRRKTLVLDAADGRWSYGQKNENYLGFPGGVSARQLRALGIAQTARFGVAFRQTAVEGLRFADGLWRLETPRGTEAARTVIWATGVKDIWPGFPGARRLIGRQLFWCIVCDGWRTRGGRVVLLGDTDAAARTTLQFLTYTPRLTLLVDPGMRGPSARARAKLEAAGIVVRRARVTRASVSDGCLRNVALEGGEALEADYVFSLLGSRPRTELLREAGVALALNGHVRIDDKNRTSHPAFFAAGDVTNKHSHQVASAVHEGSMAAQAANQVLYPPIQKI